MNIYIDCEFDALRYQGKFIQCLVSIGAVACDTQGKPVGTFYSLICPKNFRRLTSVVKRMTQLQNEAIKQAPSFPMVMDSFREWMQQVTKKETPSLYSFGPDDKRTLLTHAKYEAYPHTTWMKVGDLQRVLSASIQYQKKVISATLSLDDVKYAYHVEGDVEHNALNDAMDLMRCHEAMQKKNLDRLHVQEIWERKEAKRLETIKKEKERLHRKLHEHYGRHDGMTYHVPMYRGVVDQLLFLQERQPILPMKFYENELFYEEKTYAYEQIELTITWYVNVEEPYLVLVFAMCKQYVSFTIVLRYGTASVFDGISKVDERYQAKIETVEQILFDGSEDATQTYK